MGTTGHILLVNPWIYDFAAYNLWIEPLGLLTIAAALRDSGYDVTVIDCLAPHPGAPRSRPDGSGKFVKTRVDKPEVLAFVPRHYGRYGLPLDQFDAALATAPAPDLVLVASGMTYWYPGIVEAVRRVQAHFGAVPLALGGIYASLCPEHARKTVCAGQQADAGCTVIAGPGVVGALCLADQVTGRSSDPDRYADPRTWPAPAHDLVCRSFAGLLTSWGCPYRCTYCASHRLQPAYIRRSPAAVLHEIEGCLRRGIRDFAFYDDALLVDAGRHLVPLLEAVRAREKPVRFHAPNGLHAREITASLATLMHQAGFESVRLALETTDAARQKATGGKVTTATFERAVGHLKAAGFQPGQLAAYILAGLPDQPLTEVEATVRFVHGLGLQAKLALFSPIPGTPDGDRALPAAADPLLHNNTVYPYLQGASYVQALQSLKQLANQGNAQLVG